MIVRGEPGRGSASHLGGVENPGDLACPGNPGDLACPGEPRDSVCPADPGGPECSAREAFGPRRLRADAARNRAAIVAVARDMFAEQGLEAPLEAIAARAGVGIATLYRRFPTREKLVAAALVEKVAEYAEAAEQALAAPDRWAGFAGFVQRICELQAGDRGLSELLSMTLPADEQVEQLRKTANARVMALIEYAKADGKLREDFAGEDLVLLLIATAAVMHVTHADAPEAWRRFIALALDAFRCQDSRGLPEPPTTAQMTRAMRRLAAERGCGERGSAARGPLA
jgi:AcrR family transcriptional regulator